MHCGELRQAIAETYFEELGNIPGLKLPRIRCAMEDHAWHLFIVLVEPGEMRNRIDRDLFIARLGERDTGTGVHYTPLHWMSYYRERYGLRPEMFPNAEWVFRPCVSLPM